MIPVGPPRGIASRILVRTPVFSWLAAASFLAVLPEAAPGEQRDRFDPNLSDSYITSQTVVDQNASAKGRATTFTPEGRYERITRSPSFPAGGKETGLLEVDPVQNGVAVFSLEVTMNASSSNDGALTRNGVIENETMKIDGNVGRYELRDQVLGSCTLNFKFARRSIDVSQSGNCWWFGESVNASGHYVQTDKSIPRIIRY